MGGRSRRIAPESLQGWWHVVRDLVGECRIRDAEGFDPLRHPDPLKRLRNSYRAAAAPALAQALEEAARFVARRASSNEDRELAAWLLAVLHQSVPLTEDEANVARQLGQGQLYFDDAA